MDDKSNCGCNNQTLANMLTGLQYDYDVDLKIYGTVSLSMLLCVSCFPLMTMDVIHNCKFNNQSIYILFEIEFSPAATPLRAAAALKRLTN